jgi:hypothetical protein
VAENRRTIRLRSVLWSTVPQCNSTGSECVELSNACGELVEPFFVNLIASQPVVLCHPAVKLRATTDVNYSGFGTGKLSSGIEIVFWWIIALARCEIPDSAIAKSVHPLCQSLYWCSTHKTQSLRRARIAWLPTNGETTIRTRLGHLADSQIHTYVVRGSRSLRGK